MNTLIELGSEKNNSCSREERLKRDDPRLNEKSVGPVRSLEFPLQIKNGGKLLLRVDW